MYFKLFLACAIACGSAASAHAITTITVGDHSLLPNTPGQVISILIADDGQGPNDPHVPLGLVVAIDLNLLMGGGVAGPIITNVALLAPGTIFDFDTYGQANFPQPFNTPGRNPYQYTGVQSNSVGVPGNGVVAFVTLDTSGIPLGTYPLALSSEFLGPSDTGFPDFLPTLIDGTVTVVPEPASIVMGLIGAVALGAVANRKRRAYC